MNYNQGFTASYIAYVIDPRTWRETERFRITGGSINRSDDGLRNSADLDTANYKQTREQYVRVYLDAEQGGSASHDPLFTGLACSPERNIDGVRESSTLECYSVLKAADDMRLPRGYYAPADIDGTRILQDLLSVIPAPIRVAEDAPKLRRHIIAEDGETRLTMTDKVLTAIGWHMRVNSYGEVEFLPYSRNPVVVFDPLSHDVVEPTIKVSHDWYAAPNVFRAISGDEVAVARDDSPDSPLSTVRRGREIWAEDSSVTLNTSESLAEYAQRMLAEKQETALTAEYTRRFEPGVYPGSTIQLNYPAQGLSGLFRVTSQKIELGYGAKTTEEVKKI